MFNAVSKSILITAAIMLSSCVDSEEKAALKLYQSAEEAVLIKDYTTAVALLDSIDKAYPKQIEIRRQAMHMRPKAIEGKTLRDIESNDSLIAVLQTDYVKMTPLFKRVNDPKLVEPYIVAIKADKPLFESSGIQARITTDGDFYVISSLTSKSNHTSVSFLAGGDDATTATVPYDGDRNYRSGGSEMITFINSECDTLGKFAQKHTGQSIILRFNGKNDKKVKISSEQAKAFADTYQYATIISELKSAMRRKEKLDNLLLLARDQIARTLDEDSIGDK